MKKTLITIFVAAATTIANHAIYAAGSDLYAAGEFTNTVDAFNTSGTAVSFATGLSSPTGLAFDSANNLYVANDGGNTIDKISPTGQQTTFASGLQGPQALAIDSSGNLYEADTSGAIFKFAPNGTKSTFAPPSSISLPDGLAFDSMGNLFVCSHGDGTIRKITPGGTMTTFFSGLNNPIGIAIDSTNNLFVADNFNNRIVKITPAGVLSVFASNIRAGALAFDSMGNLFAGDNGHNSIVKYASNGVGNTFATFDHVGGLAFGPAPGSAPSGQLLGISTRLDVLTGNEVAIAGFIIKGTANKQLLVRALGPTLSQFGVPNVLPDPVLTLHHTDAQGHDTVIASNDNWQTPNGAAIQATGKAPPNPLESAVLATLAPGNYTAIVTGKGAQTGNGLVEVYDLDNASSTTLNSISTRGFVGTGNNVMIAGVTSGGAGNTSVLVRALGPTLSQFGVPSVLANPQLALHDANGTLISSNDDWVTSPQKNQIQTTGLAPPNNLEPAIMTTRPAGNITAIVTGVNNTTGNALVEVYTLQ